MDKTEMPLFDVLSDSETFSPSKATQGPIGESVTNTGGANRSRKYNTAYMDHKYGDKPVKEYEPKEVDLHTTEKFKEAAREITRFVQSILITTYGAIARRYSDEYDADTLDAVLHTLRSEGILTFDDHKPAPTVVKSGSETRRVPDWNQRNNNYLFRAWEPARMKR